MDHGGIRRRNQKAGVSSAMTNIAITGHRDVIARLRHQLLGTRIGKAANPVMAGRTALSGIHCTVAHRPRTECRLIGVTLGTITIEGNVRHTRTRLDARTRGIGKRRRRRAMAVSAG